MTSRPAKWQLIALLALSLSATGGVALAAGDDAHRMAAESFKQAQAAFARRDFTAAAAAFEQAADYAPHPSPLLNAAEAWSLAGQPARAAADCDRVTSMANVGEKFLTEAAQTLATLEPRIATLDVTGPRTAAIRVDDDTDRVVPVRRRLAPGKHSLTVIDLGSSQSRRFDVELVAGEKRTIDVGAPPWAAPAIASLPPPAKAPVVDEGAPRPADKAARHVPTGAYVAFGLAGAAAGVSAVFGALTLAAQSTFHDAPTHEHADAFKRDRLVTNVSLAIAGASALTGGALWLTSGDGAGETALVVAPNAGGVTLSSRVRFLSG